jgi:hypothetical protein
MILRSTQIGESMNNDRYLEQIRDSAEQLSALLTAPSNAPVEEYLDLESAKALALAMALDPDKVTAEDLERLLLIRAGFYAILRHAKDRGSAGSHSIDHIISGMSRLYVDLEDLVRSRDPEVASAVATVAEMQNTPQISLDPRGAVSTQIAAQASEVITQTIITNRTVNISLINMGDLEILRNLKIDVHRLSASVIAIKMQMLNGVLFQGTIKFLNENVDRIIGEIKLFAEQLAKTFANTTELLSELDPLIEKGTRFVKLIGNVITGFFKDERDPQLPDYRFTVLNGYSGPAILTAANIGREQVAFAGRRGQLVVINSTTQRAEVGKSSISDDIRALAHIGDGNVAVASSNGLAVTSALINTRPLRSSLSENLVAVAVTHWGGRGSSMVTGARDGAIRRWSFSGGLSQFRDGVVNREFHERIAKTVQVILPWNNNVLVASGERLVLLDERLEIVDEIPIERKVLAMCPVTEKSVIAVGAGFIHEVHLDRGSYDRMITGSSSAEYTGVAKLAEEIIAVSTAKGVVRAYHVRSGTELGGVDLRMDTRGLIVSGSKLYVFGGEWSGKSKAVIALGWEELRH